MAASKSQEAIYAIIGCKRAIEDFQDAVLVLNEQMIYHLENLISALEDVDD